MAGVGHLLSPERGLNNLPRKETRVRKGKYKNKLERKEGDIPWQDIS